MAADNNKQEATLAVISTQITMMNQNIMENFKNIREDIKSMEAANRANLESLEGRLNKRIDSTNKRVETLEKEEKDTIATKAKHGVFAGGAGAVLTYGFLELIKRLH
ncbi:MAG: hypothetical protein Q7U15_06105 [Methylotenera sp.]|jgi:peptidoglycan hydrolase CwlO-like protein|nr:hypothetical protein [Methylotenera sp.]